MKNICFLLSLTLKCFGPKIRHIYVRSVIETEKNNFFVHVNRKSVEIIKN